MTTVSEQVEDGYGDQQINATLGKCVTYDLMGVFRLSTCLMPEYHEGYGYGILERGEP